MVRHEDVAVRGVVYRSSMETVGLAALVLAALEVAPADPADLTRILRDHGQLHDLTSGLITPNSSPLTRYLVEAVDPDRVLHWRDRLDREVEGQSAYRLLVAGNDDYPARLATVWDAPPVLFARGEVADDRAPAAAIIGSRDADATTLKAASDIARVLAADGADIVSGLALGVDGAAHRGALLAGRTTAVLGTGILDIYPSAHASLAEDVVRQGALISQFPPNAPRTGTSFLVRNATIAALSDVFVVMDASERSGSRQALTRALEYGRPCVMWRPTLGRLPWATELASTGAARFFDEAHDVQEILHTVPA